ncbi:uncharacterized protein LOC110827696 [Zootermopsis nevadensis]|uniref:uncharacterized protein LOC110827696 n=1 Tax=Zootermopsis nevadensis TaxID=136037 RepID=UPI000B8E96C4|nr:uncharacterized protein LOC110827696 [Zootermopsis nevadensis]
MLFSSDMGSTQRRMAQWVVTGILFQLFRSGNQFPSPSTKKLDNKVFGRLKNFELDNKIGSSGFSKFEYPKEDTTHGVGYGHHLHPFYYQGLAPLYSCAIQGEWYPIAQHAHHSNTIQNHDRSASELNEGVNYNPFIYSTDYINSENSNGRKTVMPENHLKYFKYTTENFYEEGGAREMHQKFSNKTAASQSDDNEGIPTYLTPPLPPTSTMNALVQLQELFPHKKRYAVREEQKLLDILTTLHILPHPEEMDYF